jgi:hypothetical protein
MKSAVFVLLIVLVTSGIAPAEPESPRYAIAVHGGAGGLPSATDAARNRSVHDGMRRALKAGVEILRKGGSSLEAVEATVRILEDDPAFNAGKGAVLNAEGKAELDASIMDGRTLKCGAVAGATPIAFPSKVREAGTRGGIFRVVFGEDFSLELESRGAQFWPTSASSDLSRPQRHDSRAPRGARRAACMP